MRHNRRTKRFNRSYGERQAMLENIVSALLSHQTIQTTVQKAKEAQRLADHVIQLGKDDTLAARRQAFGYLQDHQLISKLFKEVAPRFKNRAGGYTRIMRLGRRKGDGAEVAILELTEKEIKLKEPKKRAKKGGKGDDHGHDHDHGDHGHEHGPDKPKSKGPDKGSERPTDSKKDKPKTGFFKDLGKFFRNKGGG
jgi:large subunit ribosomal protein L17